MEDNREWRFCVSGNIVKTHLDETGIVRYGTKAFTGGTKVYIYGRNPDSDYLDLFVIGRNRFGRYAFEGVPLSLVENNRAQRVYKTTVLDMMNHDEAVEGASWWGQTATDRRETEAFAKKASCSSELHHVK